MRTPRRGGSGYGILLFFPVLIALNFILAWIGVYPNPGWLALVIPPAAALVILSVAAYLYNHRHWPWDRKRHKIELYRHLVETNSSQ